MNSLSFSIVINTLNRARTLRDTLVSLAGLSYPSFEVIVVNGPSSDGTDAVLEGWKGYIKTARCDEPNLSKSRNVGIQAAAGDIVAFIDDDAAPHPAWLTELAKPYVNPAVAAVGGFTIDNTGSHFQARKTICDRFGNAFYVSPFFDERPLNVKGSSHYPSLLGTNSSFRRSVLVEVGGFDHTFAYLLDETDLCLRVVDAGYQIEYAPRAIVFHQFAESGLRSPRRLPKTLYPSVVSKSYFIMRHGAKLSVPHAAQQLESYRAELTSANKWLEEHGEIAPPHRVSLDQDVAWGAAHGIEAAVARSEVRNGDLDTSSRAEPFLAMPRPERLRIALVSQSFPPANDAGIARWTSMMAQGLTRRGHHVHVIARADKHPVVCFQDGYWLHRIKDDPAGGATLTATLDLPPNIASWTAAVRREVDSLRTFGLDVVSFPIWDVEGISVAAESDLGIVMSLHTTYKMAQPFKEEWRMRPIYTHMMVDKMIRRERELLASAPVVLANSQAIVDDLTTSYGVAFADRAIVAAHGTLDPFEMKPARREMRAARRSPFQVAFVGRFEPRKGYDIAAAAIAQLLQAHPEATALFIGDTLAAEVYERFAAVGVSSLLNNPQVSFVGPVSREELDDTYATCDVALMPSRYESFGLVAIEAMAAGAVVIALATGGLKEVVTHSKTGFLVPPEGDAAGACAAHLSLLARNRELCQKMSAAARADFEQRFTVAAMVDAAEPAYWAAATKKRNTDAT